MEAELELCLKAENEVKRMESLINWDKYKQLLDEEKKRKEEEYLDHLKDCFMDPDRMIMRLSRK